MTMNDPLLRTDSYAKIFLYNTHESIGVQGVQTR